MLNNQLAARMQITEMHLNKLLEYKDNQIAKMEAQNKPEDIIRLVNREAKVISDFRDAMIEGIKSLLSENQALQLQIKKELSPRKNDKLFSSCYKF